MANPPDHAPSRAKRHFRGADERAVKCADDGFICFKTGDKYSPFWLKSLSADDLVFTCDVIPGSARLHENMQQDGLPLR